MVCNYCWTGCNYALFRWLSFRLEEKPVKFATVNIVSILTNISLNLFFVGYLINAGHDGVDNFFTRNFYNPEIGVGYVFLSNLIASIVKFLLLTPMIFKVRLNLERNLIREMAMYASPLLLASLAGIINETVDKIMLKRILFNMLGETGANEQVGIYGACYKISIIINLFVQAYRYAAEPFFFNEEKEKNARESYARIMKYFVAVLCTIFLGVMLFLDVIKHFIGQESYWVGLGVVPILLMANICLGIFYNLSVWYKLGGKNSIWSLHSWRRSSANDRVELLVDTDFWIYGFCLGNTCLLRLNGSSFIFLRSKTLSN